MKNSHFHTRYAVILFIAFIASALPQIGICDNSAVEEAGSIPRVASGNEWKVGFWYWREWGRGEQRIVEKTSDPVDILYVKAGDYRPMQGEYGGPDMSWPEYAPKARAYFAVLRCEGQACLKEETIPHLIDGYQSLKRKASQGNQLIAGMQIDYDCATKDLALYAKFLRKLRRNLTTEDLLSITALLDWFSTRTRVADVIRQVDEFVPQFYDVNPSRAETMNGGIAESVDAARWAPIFNRYGKPYRIGIASFGRLLVIYHRKTRNSSGNEERVTVRGESPLEMLAYGKGRFVGGGTSPAGEIIAFYEGGEKHASIRAREEKTKLIAPTRQSILSAYTAARNMGGFCRGVVFFRDSLYGESLVLSSSEVIRMISGEKPDPTAAVVEARDGLCAAVTCTDLFLRLKERFPPKDLVITIRSSLDLDYFVPDRLVSARMRGPRLVEVKVPAFAGSPAIPVGRAVSREPVEFIVEENR